MSDLYKKYTKHYERMGHSISTGPMPARDSSDGLLEEDWLPLNLEARILDIGCGWGELLFQLWSKGYRFLTGVEHNEDQYRIAQDRLPKEIILACQDAIQFTKETSSQFDLIIAFDVLEHLSIAQSVDLLRGCYERLSPGGSVVVRVPNMANILAAYSRYMDITHISGHTEWSMFQLFDMAGFERHLVIRSKWFDFAQWRRYGSLLKPWRGLGLRDFLNNVLHSTLFVLRGQKPRPTTYAFNIVIQSWKEPH